MIKPHVGPGTQLDMLPDTRLDGRPFPTPKLSLAEAQAIVDTKPAPRVTVESIEAKIERVEYMRPFSMGPTTTICIIRMFNGFVVHGLSAAASAANYDREVGERYAYDNAFKQLWQLEGYLLREKLSAGPL